MNREIKFRCFFYDGKDYKTGEMLSGVKAFAENYIDWDNGCLQPTDECTILMQYIGLKDKNGKEVYDYDILIGNKPFDIRWPITLPLIFVYWSEEEACFLAKYLNDEMGNTVPMSWIKEFEVIGNKYEDYKLEDDAK